MSGKNPFYTDDDAVDDDEFLRRSGRGGYMLPNHSGAGSGMGGAGVPRVDPIDERRQQLMQKRREIEERTLESSQRSIGLLYESEKVGVATAEELSRQKEQLKNTEQRLDDINSTLKQSERHLQGIKSVFGGLRNYFSGKGAASAAASTAGKSSLSANVPGLDNTSNELYLGGQAGRAPVQDAPSAGSRVGPSGAYPDGGGVSVPPSNPSHPGLMMRGIDDGPRGAGAGAPVSTTDAVNAQLDRDLEDMSRGLSRLKGLAQNLNSELEDHNEIIDRLDDKTSNTNWRVQKQNKDMSKLLGGKKS